MKKEKTQSFKNEYKKSDYYIAHNILQYYCDWKFAIVLQQFWGTSDNSIAIVILQYYCNYNIFFGSPGALVISYYDNDRI